MKGTVNCCKLQLIFQSKRKLSNMSRFKGCVPYDLVSGVVYQYMCGRCKSSYYDERDALKSKVWWTYKNINAYVQETV